MDVRMQLPTAAMPKGVLEVCIYKNLPKSKKKGQLWLKPVHEWAQNDTVSES